MSNPTPRLENLTPFAKRQERDLGKVTGTRFPIEVEAALSHLPDKQAYIRSAVENQLIADGLL